VVAECLREAGIKAVADVRDWNSLMAEFIFQGKLEAMFFGWSLTRDPDHLYDFWRTGQLYNEFIYRYHNPEYDELVDNMMAATTKEEAIEYAKQAQWILYEDQPIIPIYQNTLLSAFRIDEWTGFVNAKGDGVPNFWTWTQARLKTGEFGGTFRVSLPEPPDTLNPLSTDSAYSWMVLGCIYESLIAVHPYTWEDLPWMAKSWSIETVDDVEYGKVMKITFNLIDNATWHDGTPVTADDVIFSFWLVMYTQAPFIVADDHVINVTKVNDYTVTVYDFKPGFFEFHRVAGMILLPMQVWANPTVFGKTGFNPSDVKSVIDQYASTDWKAMNETLTEMFQDAGLTPDLILGYEPDESTLIGSGPYKMKEIRVGEYYDLTVYEDHPYCIRKVVKPTAPPTTPPPTVPSVPGALTFTPATYAPTTFGPTEVPPVLSQQSLMAYALIAIAIVVGLVVGFIKRK